MGVANCSNRRHLLPGIQQRNTEQFKVLDVTRHHYELVDLRDCGNETIPVRTRIRDMKLCAAFSCHKIKWQHVPLKSRQDAICQPRSEDLSLVACLDVPCAAPQSQVQVLKCWINTNSRFLHCLPTGLDFHQHPKCQPCAVPRQHRCPAETLTNRQFRDL
jgi:hypothetical protein